MILNAWNRFRGLHHEAAARECKEMARKMEEEISSLYGNIEVAGKVADKLWLLEIENRKLRAWKKELASARSRIGAKTRAVNKLAARAESNKSHLGRFYWPATAYCEAATPST